MNVRGLTLIPSAASVAKRRSPASSYDTACMKKGSRDLHIHPL